jgi:hypothetical protein
MSPPRRPRRSSSTNFRPETLAFIYDARDNPHYPEGIGRIWHELSLKTGRIHWRYGYSVRQACEAHGIDPDALYGRLTRPRREAAAKALDDTLRWWGEWKREHQDAVWCR